MNFPQYRKYKNNQSYFKIKNDSKFIEWKQSINKWEKFDVEATILPDRVFIADMLIEDSPYWDVISEEEYLQFLEANELG